MTLPFFALRISVCNMNFDLIYQLAKADYFINDENSKA